MTDSFVLVASVIAALALGVGIAAAVWWLNLRGQQTGGAVASNGQPARTTRTPLVLMAIAMGLVASVGVLYAVTDRTPGAASTTIANATTAGAGTNATPAVSALAASLNTGNGANALPAVPSTGAAAPKGGDLDVMTERLAKRLKERTPEDYESWSLLARSYVELGRDAEAVAAYERTGPLLKSDATLKAELDAVKVRVATAGKSGVPLVKPAAADTVAAAGSPVISGKVDVSPALKAKLPKDGFIFIIARAEGQAGAPLAAKRLPMTALPMNFALTDADSMLPGQKLSGVKTVALSARFSETGDASPASGALESVRETVAVGRKDATLVLSTRRE